MKKISNSLLKNEAFRILALVTGISSIGDSLYSLAITLSVYNITGSLMGVAGMWIIRAIIRIPCQFFSGIMIDRYNKKKISIYVYLLSAILMFAIAFTNDKYIMLAFLAVFFLQGTSDIDNMSQMAIMSEMIPEDELTDAESVFSAIGSVVLLIGPGLGAFLYKHFGTSILYVLDGISFLIAALFMSRLKYNWEKEEKEIEEFTLFSHAKKGFCEVKKLPIIQYAMLISIFFGMLGRFYEIDKVYLADKIFHVGAEGIIYFEYAMLIGGLIAPIVASLVKRIKMNEVKKYALSCLLYASCFIFWGCSENIVLALVANTLIGIFETSQGVMTNVIFMSKVNKEVMGMVMAFRKIVIVFSAILGALLAPILVEICGVPVSFHIVGGMTIIACLFIALNGKKEKLELQVENQ